MNRLGQRSDTMVSGLSSFVSQHADNRMINEVAGLMYSTATKTMKKFGVVSCYTSSDVGPV